MNKENKDEIKKENNNTTNEQKLLLLTKLIIEADKKIEERYNLENGKK